MPVTRKMLEDEAATRFGRDSVKGVMALLEQYKDKEPERVQMCILLLSKDIADIRHNVRQAQMDYRDVLYWADPDGKLV
jgi:hypothetical protein